MPTFAPNNLVPVADTADNVTSGDVIGNKTDTAAGTSLIALIRQFANGDVVETFPVLSAGVNAIAGAANAYGATAELAAGGLVAVDSRLASISLRTPSAACTGKVNIGHGAGPTFVCEVDFEIATDAGAFLNIPLVGMGGVIPAGDAVSVQIKTTAGATTVDCSVGIMPAI